MVVQYQPLCIRFPGIFKATGLYNASTALLLLLKAHAQKKFKRCSDAIFGDDSHTQGHVAVTI